jgi:hypothetical protein
VANSSILLSITGIWRRLLVSLGVHGWGYVWSKSLPIRGLSESPAPALLPPKFVVRQVQFDPKSLQDAPEPAPAAKEGTAVPGQAGVF